MAGFVDRLLGIDRRWLFLLVFLGVAIPIIKPMGLPVTTTGSTRAAFEYIDALKPGDTVIISYDYGPSSAPENDPMAEGIMRQCFLKKIHVVIMALYPLGGLQLASNSLAKVTAEFPNLKYGEDYVNLGFKDGAQAVMKRMGDDIVGAFPTDVRGTPLAQIPMLKGVRSLRQISVVCTIATGIIGEWWITQAHPQSGTPIIVGPTAVGAPKYYAYLNAGQLVGMLSGMKGAAEYEKLLAAQYPELAVLYKTTRAFTATKGMDAQTVIHFVIIVFILIGNAAYMSHRATQRKAEAAR
jgi:hypothetical protein